MFIVLVLFTLLVGNVVGFVTMPPVVSVIVFVIALIYLARHPDK